MDRLFEKSKKKIDGVNSTFSRFLADKINWKHRLIAITGARGVGKTTLTLQYLKQLQLSAKEVLYISLDNIYFSSNKMIDVVDYFVKYGGKVVVLDEVHKYSGWSQEIKNIYDDYGELQTIFTGSSILQISKGVADLSRRAVTYLLPAMSFREYIEYEEGKKFPMFGLQEILTNSPQICSDIIKEIKPLPLFRQYLQLGCYPYYKEAKEELHSQLLATINLILETDLPSVETIDYSGILKLKRLLVLIAENVPFKPNISEMSRKIQISRDSIMKYLDFLIRAQLISMLESTNKGFRRFEKPQKIYLENSNQLYALSQVSPNSGTIRETFFLQQTSYNYTVNYTDKGDFKVENKYIFEVGGSKKNYNQIKDLPNSYIAADNIEYGHGNKIPLWLFGFLY